MNAGKKTIAPADVFKALEEIEFSFLKDALEAEFASSSCPLFQEPPTWLYFEKRSL
jgi:hypothetical protein